MAVITQLCEMRREIVETVKSLDIRWPSADDMLWFDVSCCRAADLGIKVHRDRAISSIPNVPRSVSKLINFYSKLCNIGEVSFSTGPSAPVPMWKKGEEPKWSKNVKNVTSVWISSLNFSLSKDCLGKAVDKIIKEIDSLWRDECLIVHGFPIFFELNICVLFLIGTFFKKVGLVCPHGSNAYVLLYKFDSWDLATKKTLKNILLEVADADPMKLYISGGTHFFDSDFYRATVDMGYVYLKESIFDVLENVEEVAMSHFGVGGTSNRSEVEVHTDHSRYNTSLLLSLNQSQELELASVFLNQIDLSYPCGEEGAIWLEFPETNLPNMSLVRRSSSSSASSCDLTHSKFCSRPLLQCHRKLCKILQENRHLHFTCINASRPLPSSIKNFACDAWVLDFSMETWIDMEVHIYHQCSMLKRIIALLENLPQTGSFVLRGYLMLSDFNVSVVFLLGFLFKRVGLLVPKEIEDTALLFYKFHGLDQKITLHLRKAAMKNDIMSLVPLKEIFGAKFYDSIKYVNNVCLKHHSDHLVHSMKKTTLMSKKYLM